MYMNESYSKKKTFITNFLKNSNSAGEKSDDRWVMLSSALLTFENNINLYKGDKSTVKT